MGKNSTASTHAYEPRSRRASRIGSPPLTGHLRSSSSYFSAAWVSVLAILFSSKFLIIAAVGAVFGDSAVLGHFVEVVLIVLTMMIARAVVDQIYQRLGGVREPLRLSDFTAPSPPAVHVVDRETVEAG